MECGNTKFLVGLGLGSAIGALVYHFSRTAKAKKLKMMCLMPFMKLRQMPKLQWKMQK